MKTARLTLFLIVAFALPAFAELGQSTSAALPKLSPAEVSAQAFSLAGKIVALQVRVVTVQEISPSAARLQFVDGVTVISGELPTAQAKAAAKRATLYVTPIDPETVRILGDTVAYDRSGQPQVSWAQR